MGIQVSTASLTENEFLKALQDESTSNAAIHWEGLSSFPQCYPTALTNPALNEILVQITDTIARHSAKTMRTGAVVKRICDMVSGWTSNRPEEVAYGPMCNLLLFLQHLMRSARDVSREDRHAFASICAVPTQGAEENGAASQNGCTLVVDSLVTFIRRHPVLNMNSGCVNSHALALGVITVCCASPLYDDPPQPGGAPSDLPSQPPTPLPYLDQGEGADCIDQLCERADVESLLSTLFGFISKADYTLNQSTYTSVATLQSWLEYAAILLPTSIVGHLPYRSTQWSHVQQSSAHLGRRAALLLMVLLYRRKNESQQNPSKLLLAFRSEATDADFPVAVFDALCRPGALQNPELVLLLYSLLNENKKVIDFILHDPDVSRLVLPLTELLNGIAVLWEAPASLYVLLSVLLILSQHRSFNTSMHESSYPLVLWYKERTIRDISAGSLLILVLVKVIQYNVANHEDTYVTRQCLSILSNMGSGIKNVHEYTAQRLVQLALFLGKRANRVSAETDAFLDFLKNTLGAINVALANSAAENVQLIYELLHQQKAVKDMLCKVKPEGAAQSIKGILSCIDYFDAALDRVGEPLNSVEEVSKVLAEAALTWDPSVCGPPTGDRFAFAEESCPEVFFVPYAWDLVLKYYSEHLAWDERYLPLFACKAATPDEEGEEQPGNGPFDI
ncbi:Dymeclin [Diplonema papillatum]|nr:Dymeclin [Diplonema papillatum]